MDSKLLYVVKVKNSAQIKGKKINIDGSTDQFYRYKMTQLLIKIIGSGKMVKTIFVNNDDVARELHVQPDYISAYIGYMLSAKFKYDFKNKNEHDRAHISGDRSVDEISNVLEDMINKIVLCKTCRLPELSYCITKEVTVRCSSCGSKYELTKVHPKFIKYMILNKPKKPRIIISPENDNDDHHVSNCITITGTDTKWFADTSKDAVNARLSELTSAGAKKLLEE